MDRRKFMTATGLGAVVMTGLAKPRSAKAAGNREYYELRRYIIETPEQRAGFDAFMRDAAIPAWNRAGVKPVGVFAPTDGPSPMYVLMCHQTAESIVTATAKLMADPVFVAAGAAYLDSPADKPAYKRMESSLMVAFTGMPTIETPIKTPGRIAQLRIYESPTVKTGAKKIEMFNTAEIAIFRKNGLNPVFFGQTLVGDKMPNLTYMLVFENADAQKAAWQKFSADPDWQALRAKPEYADDKILCGITNTVLAPTDYSQI